VVGRLHVIRSELSVNYTVDRLTSSDFDVFISEVGLSTRECGLLLALQRLLALALSTVWSQVVTQNLANPFIQSQAFFKGQPGASLEQHFKQPQTPGLVRMVLEG
jgi:hypothetical protein